MYFNSGLDIWQVCVFTFLGPVWSVLSVAALFPCAAVWRARRPGEHVVSAVRGEADLPSSGMESLAETARFVLSTATSDSSSVSVNYFIPIFLASSWFTIRYRKSRSYFYRSSPDLHCCPSGSVQPGCRARIHFWRGRFWIQCSRRRLRGARPVL